ncbi:MAG: cyclodeaminase/cyclohydrolase family protein [Actinobacteria bacterium]|nr:cyclodeaminase/cyclohydrolase family protein [Actinomycetota bacterium]
MGALGAALVTMVCDLTLGKDKFAAVQESVGDIRSHAEMLRAELTRLVTTDAEAYAEVASAMKLPRDTEEQRSERSRALQAALRGAAAVPLRVAEAAREVARLTLPAAEQGNPNAVSDAGVAVLLADAAAQSAALNVKINLGWIEDGQFKEDAWTHVQAVLVEVARLREQVMALTYSKL